MPTFFGTVNPTTGVCKIDERGRVPGPAIGWQAGDILRGQSVDGGKRRDRFLSEDVPCWREWSGRLLVRLADRLVNAPG